MLIIIVLLFSERMSIDQAGKSRVRFPMVSLEFFIYNPSGRTMALGYTQPLTQMITKNITWG
jgi:hypothetical protein